ncbi:hypothetical protein ABT124_38870 [Streptomyces sp. NPDC001982]
MEPTATRNVQHYSVMYDHLQAQAQALSPDSTRDFITTKSHIDAASRP